MTEEEMKEALIGNKPLAEQAKSDVDRLSKALDVVFQDYMNEKDGISFYQRLVVLGRVLNTRINSHFSDVAKAYYLAALDAAKSIKEKE